MYPVLCNMKRVSITFLPFIPVVNRVQVLQIPSYTTIDYATAVNTQSPTKHLRTDSLQFSIREQCKDITFFLTKLDQYNLTADGQTENTIHLKMWTYTTTGTNNKKRFVTLITPINRFFGRTMSARTDNHWEKSANNVSLKLIITTNNPTYLLKP